MDDDDDQDEESNIIQTLDDPENRCVDTSEIKQFEKTDIVQLLNTDNFKFKYLYFDKINDSGILVTRTNYFYIFKKDIVLTNPTPDFDLNDNNIAYQLSSPEDEKTIINSFENIPGYELGNNHDYVAKYKVGWLWTNHGNIARGSFLLVKPEYRRQGWGTYLYMINASLAFNNSVSDIEAMNVSGNWTIYGRLGMQHNPREDDEMWGKTSILSGAISMRLFCRNYLTKNPKNFRDVNGICDNTGYRASRLKSPHCRPQPPIRTIAKKPGPDNSDARAAARTERAPRPYGGGSIIHKKTRKTRKIKTKRRKKLLKKTIKHRKRKIKKHYRRNRSGGVHHTKTKKNTTHRLTTISRTRPITTMKQRLSRTEYITKINRIPITKKITELKSTTDMGSFCHYLITQKQSGRYPNEDIGAGIFGKVVTLRIGKTTYACKIIQNFYDKQYDDVINEINFQIEAANLGISPQIYDYYQCNYEEDIYYIIIMEYLEGYEKDQDFRRRMNHLKTSIQNTKPLGEDDDGDDPRDDLIEEYTAYNNAFKASHSSVMEKYDSLNIDISDFQYMVKPGSDIKIIDFGLAKKK